MTKMQSSYSPELHESAVLMVFDTRTPEESLKAACTRVAPKVSVKFATLYNWCKHATPKNAVSPRKAQTVGELEAEVRSLKKELRETKRANEIRQAAATFFLGGDRPSIPEIAKFVRQERGRFGVDPICEVLQVAPRTIRAHLVRPVSRRSIDDAQLAEKIKTCFEANYSCYGYRKMCAQLGREGTMIGPDRCRRLMKALGIQGARRGRTIRTTRPDPGDVRAEDLVKRDFTASRPDELWVCDFTQKLHMARLAKRKRSFWMCTRGALSDGQRPTP